MPALGAHFGVEQLRVINDFTALALPALGNAGLLTIGRVNASSDNTPNTVPFCDQRTAWLGHWPGRVWLGAGQPRGARAEPATV